jgi:hypothetical protein
VSARSLLVLFDSVYLTALTAWVGSILFFSFGVAPVIFRVLDAESAARFVRALFPRYYLWGAISGSVALPAYVAGPLCYPEFRGPWVGAQALVILGCILVMLYGGNSLVPQINRARDAGPSGHDRFERLHRRSVRLNALVLAVGLGLLVAFASRPAPRTQGIEEMTPAERARYDAAVSRVIEDVEARHGVRTPRIRQPGEPAESEAVLDPATVREIESYYDRVVVPQRADPEAKANRAPGTAKPGGAPHSGGP